MKKQSLFALVLASTFAISSAQAAISLKPGLWEIKSKMKTANGAVDPMAQAHAAMAKMPAAQRKQMEAAMAHNGASMNGNAIKVCYSQDMFKNPQSIVQNQANGECTSKVNTQTASKLDVEFTCKNGSRGSTEMNFHGDDKYDGVSKMTDPKGGTTEISQDAHFVSADCGKLKAKM